MSRKSKIDLFIATAKKYLGYQSEILGQNMFGRYLGYDSVPWSGAFIDVVARESGVKIPSFIYVPAALSDFIRSNGVYSKPRPGDIAIFSFPSISVKGSTGSSFDMPTAGIVVDVREFKKTGKFLTVEGNTLGDSKHQQKDGVHLKVRHLTDVVLFCRPEEFQGPKARSAAALLTKLGRKLTGLHPDRIELSGLEELTNKPEQVKTAALRAGTRNRSIEVVQLALSTMTDIKGAERGKWDSVTASAFARYQRSIGVVNLDLQGTIHIPTLEHLAKETNLFIIV